MFKAFTAKLKSIFLGNLGLKLFSLLIALLLWLFVMGAEDITITANIRMSIQSADDKVLVSDVPDRVNVTVSGPWASVKGWDWKNHLVDLDFRDLELGPTVIYLEESKLKLPPGLTLERVNPSEITINYAKKASKKVKVVPVWVGSPRFGYMVENASIDPAEITIVGAESDLLIVDEVLTEEIDVEDRFSTFSVAVNPVRLSKNISFPDKDPLLLTIKIKKDIVERKLESVPVYVENSEYETQVIPSRLQVSVSGLRKAVGELNPDDIYLFVDASKEEGDNPGTMQNREIEVRLPSNDIKIKLPIYTVKLKISDQKKHVPVNTEAKEEKAEE